jgi:hypothetical protein
MHPETSQALAAEHRRELIAQAAARASARARRPRAALPHYKLTFTRASLGAAAGRRERSWVIVISATRAV